MSNGKQRCSVLLPFSSGSSPSFKELRHMFFNAANPILFTSGGTSSLQRFNDLGQEASPLRESKHRSFHSGLYLAWNWCPIYECRLTSS